MIEICNTFFFCNPLTFISIKFFVCFQALTSLPEYFLSFSVRQRQITIVWNVNFLFVLSFQEAHRVKNFCDCCNHHRSRAGHCGRASNLASFVARNVCHGNLSSRLLLSWCLSWTCCCHLYCVYRRCCLCTGKILASNFKHFH